jgi:hypothetical protein
VAVANGGGQTLGGDRLGAELGRLVLPVRFNRLASLKRTSHTDVSMAVWLT